MKEGCQTSHEKEKRRGVHAINVGSKNKEQRKEGGGRIKPTQPGNE